MFKKQPPKKPATAPLRPGQQPARPQQPGTFPAVGMTLSSYRHDPFEHLKATPGTHRMNRPSRFGRLRTAFTLKRIVLTLVVVLLVAGGWIGWKVGYNLHRLFGGNPLSIFTTSRLDGESNGRVTILLAGDSSDDPGHEGANLTDSIMLLSIDTKNHQAFMLSVPRDLYVNIPGDGHQKINAANVYGSSEKFSQSGFPSGGMGLLEKTLEQDLGVDINYYALINYTAFKQAVDAVGGIDINIQSDDPRGLYDPNIDYATHKPLVKLSNGWHHLNGQQALDLARARGDAYNSYGFPQSDFDRTAHQRQMLLALKAKATSAGVVTNPLKLGQLFDAVGKNVQTDLTASNVHRLYDLTQGITPGNIKSLSLNDANGKNLLQSYQSPDGASALIPATGLDNFSQIKSYLRGLTSNNPVVKEGATVVVLNGTDSYGLASKEQKILESRFLTVTTIGDATGTYPTSTIIDNSAAKKPATKLLLQDLFGSNITTHNPYAGKYDADFIVIVGNDKLPK